MDWLILICEHAGTFGLMYTNNETKRMQVFNQTQIMNGTNRRHDYSLERMDTGKEYYIDYNSQYGIKL